MSHWASGERAATIVSGRSAYKETLWRAVMDASKLEVGARFQAALQESGTCAQRMFAIITAYPTAVKDIPAMPALMFADPTQMDGAGKYLRQEITARFGWFHGALCGEADRANTLFLVSITGKSKSEPNNRHPFRAT